MGTGSVMAATHAAGPTDVPNRSVWERAAASFDDWRNGDQAALDELVRALTPVLWHVVRAYGLTPAATEDVIQTTWLALVRHGHQVNESAAVGGWLLTTARRTAWRAKSVDGRAIPVEDVDLAPSLPHTSAAESTAIEHLSASSLWQQVQQLDDRCQRLLRIVAFDDRPDYAGLASELGMPVGSIGPTRRRCLDKLRVALQKGDQP
ncbi:MAG: sigma-70 family RNA polymerase sigma factor [Micropruina sp.]